MLPEIRNYSFHSTSEALTLLQMVFTESDLELMQRVVLLPDFYYKDSIQRLKGMAIYSMGLTPNMIPKNPGCGVLTAVLNLHGDRLPPSIIGAILEDLRGSLPDNNQSPCQTSKAFVTRLLSKYNSRGESDCKKYFGPDTIDYAVRQFGKLGASGNHFVEIGFIDACLGNSTQTDLGSCIIMVHTDGARVTEQLTHKLCSGIYGADEIATAMLGICEYSSAIRSFVLSRVIESLGRIAGRCEHKIISDSRHNDIVHFRENGSDGYLSRFGGTHWQPSPFPVLGGLKRHSYLCVPGDCSSCLATASHGCARTSSTEEHTDDEGRGVVVHQVHGSNLKSQHRKNFVSIEDTVKLGSQHGLLKPIIRLKPLGVLKG